jgi:hypothetical protein
MRLRALFTILAVLLAALPIGAGSLANAASPAAAGLASVRNFAFIASRPSGWRQIETIRTPLFKAGEAIQFYAEPVAIGWSGSGRSFRFALDVDLEIRSMDGRVLWGQKDFARLTRDTVAADPNTYITGALAVEGLAPGVYMLGIRMRDGSNRLTAEAQSAFAIVAEPRRIDA